MTITADELEKNYSHIIGANTCNFNEKHVKSMPPSLIKSIN